MAVRMYTSMEVRFDKQIMHKLPIYKMHKSEDALEAWMKAHNSEQNPYVQSPAPQFPWQRHTDHRFGAILVHSAMRVDTGAMTDAFFSGAFAEHVSAHINYADIQIKTDHIIWNNNTYKNVIFCEGVHVTNNPWFGKISLKPAKGECMVVHIPYLQADCMLQKKVFAVPLGNDRYWIGATNDFNDPDNTPTEQGSIELTEGLRDMIKLAFTIEGHYAAVRPTMRDRTPAIGTHHTEKTLHILNGLGTKGSMLAPYYAHQLFEYILHGQAINREADVNRINY